MKDAIVNLLVFLLVFLAVALAFLATYGLSLILIPGGRGLVFSNPFAAALFPALLGGLVVAQFRSVHRPGVFAATWSLQALAFFLLLTLPLPLFQQMPSIRASDESPMTVGRFLPLEDGSQLLSAGESASILVPSEGGLMKVSRVTQFDPMNQRFVFSDGPPRALGSTGPERQYYQYTEVLASFQTDLLAVYSILKASQKDNPFLFWAQAAVITWLFMGLYFFFSLRTWPLVQVVLVLVLVRLGLTFLVYAFWSLPLLVDLWLPGATAFRDAAPVALVAVAAATLFFMTLLSKPHRQAALS